MKTMVFVDLVCNKNLIYGVVCVVIAVSGHQGLQQDPADGGSAAALPKRWAGREEENPWRGDEGAVQVSYLRLNQHFTGSKINVQMVL